jgi:hypothetical protein
MNERYIIRDLDDIFKRYWSKTDSKGLKVKDAIKFMSESDARTTIVSRLPQGNYQIVKIYSKI